ncbi:hypothetical protein [Desulfonema magnum]|uniref:PIN domain-containing protein n=1 Tax=Desulfonema magnum TaxID=45655 RepID=A0A975GRG8_9BACT|nr:hypothetical protein [Desulfonema magnum]QTA90897.1 Uncharacterized protein dnm_069590 [Desulfonema magnum]
MEYNRAFLDTNVLVNILAESYQGQYLFELLKNNNFQIVTFRKCIYEVYSILKGTTKSGLANKNNPLKHILPPEINDIAQKLFKKVPDIDKKGNTYYWYNLCEEWQGWNFFENSEKHIEEYVKDTEKKEAIKLFEIQKQFVKWKQSLLSAFCKIDAIIKSKNIYICEYFQIYTSEWYRDKGFFYEQELSKNSLLPNEDFEIIMAALFLKSKVFITNETKDSGIIWRGGLSFGLNSPSISFCCPERLEDAIRENFACRFYNKKRT